MTKYFCTLFDINYVAKGLALIASLNKHCVDPIVFVLAMDGETAQVLRTINYNNVVIINLDSIETVELLAVKSSRSKAEYCWTLSPSVPHYVLNKYPHVDFITYLDADIFFYSDLEPIFDEIGESSIAIIEHRFPLRLKEKEIYGKYCVEWVSFRRSDEGLSCLEKWRAQCIQWCYNRLEEGKMGDQKYLDVWPEIYNGCHVIRNIGAGIAPWNFEDYTITCHDSQVLINGVPLIFYHFHQFQILAEDKFDRLSAHYTKFILEPEVVYSKYEAEIKKIISNLKFVCPDMIFFKKAGWAHRLRRFAQGYLHRSLKGIIKQYIRI